MNHKNFVLFMHLSSFTRCLEIAVHNFRINSFSLVTDFNLISSNFTSLSFLKLVNELALFGALTVYVKKTFHCTRLSALQLTTKLVSKLAPKRRCSSHTFRYGYLVTT